MAVCNVCNREMTGNGCIAEKIEYRERLLHKRGTGTLYSRIRNGAEERYKEIDAVLERYDAKPGPCHDCGAPLGELHHPGCDIEECPRCRLQLIGCACNDGGTFSDVVET